MLLPVLLRRREGGREEGREGGRGEGIFFESFLEVGAGGHALDALARIAAKKGGREGEREGGVYFRKRKRGETT